MGCFGSKNKKYEENPSDAKTGPAPAAGGASTSELR